METIDDEDDGKAGACVGRNYWEKEADIPVHMSVFDISEQPFSAINASLLPDSFADAREMYFPFF